MSNINTKTVARIASIQALYQYQINNNKQTIDELVFNISQYYKDEESKEELEISDSVRIKVNMALFSNILKFTIENIDSIDETILSSLGETWKWENLHITLVALLRAAICELIYFPDTPYKVVINEFTDIASDMLKDNEVPFVNSVLDNVVKNKFILQQVAK